MLINYTLTNKKIKSGEAISVIVKNVFYALKVMMYTDFYLFCEISFFLDSNEGIVLMKLL
jgi:hypothetical protein